MRSGPHNGDLHACHRPHLAGHRAYHSHLHCLLRVARRAVTLARVSRLMLGPLIIAPQCRSFHKVWLCNILGLGSRQMIIHICVGPPRLDRCRFALWSVQVTSSLEPPEGHRADLFDTRVYIQAVPRLRALKTNERSLKTSSSRVKKGRARTIVGDCIAFSRG